jgi:hypothetical protein
MKYWSYACEIKMGVIDGHDMNEIPYNIPLQV